MILIILLVTAGLLWILEGSLYRRFWKRGLRVTLSFCQNGVTEGETAALEETIVNAGFLPLPVLHIKFQMGRELVFRQMEHARITDQNYRSDVFSCMPWQQIRRRLEFTCTKRGYYPIRQAEAVSYDLFWGGHFTETLPVDTALYVYPRTIDPPRLALPLRVLTGAAAARQALQQDPFELASIREYQPGDPFRGINWKASARTGQLESNVFAPAASLQVSFLVDCGGSGGWEDHGLKEETLRLCASLAGALIGDGVPVSVRTNGQDCLTGQESVLQAGAGSGHDQAALELLSRIQYEGRKLRPMEELLAEESVPVPGGNRESRETAVYVLLSQDQSPGLAKAFAAFSMAEPGAVWIQPVRPERGFSGTSRFGWIRAGEAGRGKSAGAADRGKTVGGPGRGKIAEEPGRGRIAGGPESVENAGDPAGSAVPGCILRWEVPYDYS